jgi:hypothetical protein
MIAATAIANELAVYTCNPDDFKGIAGLAVVAVATPPGDHNAGVGAIVEDRSGQDR